MPCATARPSARPLYVTFKLKDETGTKKERVYMGELPMMTRRGTFIINGAERVIVSPAAPFAGHLFRDLAAPQRQDAPLVPHHPGPRFLAGGAVRHQRPALRLSRPPPPPPQVPRHDLPAGPRLPDRRATSSSTSTTSRSSSSSEKIDEEELGSQGALRGRPRRRGRGGPGLRAADHRRRPPAASRSATRRSR